MKSDIKCVLFDLDNTLLPTEKNKFFEEYVKMFADLFPLNIAKERIANSILKSALAMPKNDGTQTNEMLFWNTLTDELGDEVLQYKKDMEVFHATRYAELFKYTRPNNSAKNVIQSLKEHNYRLILATDPMSPKDAQILRTKQAGLDPNDFELITSYEDFHYCKPNLNYFREILTRQNLTPQECIMVGDEIVSDMSASALGLSVFLITSNNDNYSASDLAKYPNGSLTDLCDYLTK